MRIKWFSLIRVTGLLLVLLYHFFIKYFPGGFVGVDLFFTFSGYLMTALLIDEFAASGTIDIAGFFKRRLYRIVPALVLMIGVVTPLSLLIGRNDFRAGIGYQIQAALGFMTNFFEILSGGNYENLFTPHLFVHTWSLALEIHFYIFWILVAWLLTKQVKTVGQFRGFLFLSSAGLFLLTFLGMFTASFFVDSFSTIYFSSFTHIFPFFLGASLACLAGVKERVKAFQRISQTWPIQKTLRLVAGALAVLVILLFVLQFTSIWTYLFGFLFASLAAAVLIYSLRILHEQTPEQTEPAFLTCLSDLSYGIYLFHWPFYIILGQTISNQIVVVALTLILSVVFASFSFYILEPYLAGKTGRVFSLEINLAPYGKWLAGTASLLALTTLIISLTAPRLGDFEQDMLTKGLQQAQNRMGQTKVFAEQGKASSYHVPQGVLVIGDSVTLRATPQLELTLPDALLDAQGSRNTQQAYDILKNHIDNGTLVETVVIATGVNIVYNYNEEIDKIVAALPKGHRLIFVTPYDGNSASYDNPVAQKHASYVRELAKKHDYITIADWEQASKDNPHVWEGSDGIHFGGNRETTDIGGQIYADLIKAAIEQAQEGPVKQQ